jgi:hypothetical protein
MTLQVIGTGFGRTGTYSLKLALEQLGFGPCHHMYEVRDDPAQFPFWEQAARGETPDWHAVFARYNSCVDWPAVRFWREICAAFPDAKVIHTVRDEESWLKSVYETIYPVITGWEKVELPAARVRLKMANELIANQTFQGRMGERDHALAVYRAHNERVLREIPAARLLAFDVKQGWGPLCAFLGVAVPKTPFPRANETMNFRQRATER